MAAMNDSPSVIREKPQPEVAVMTRLPTAEAPIIMLMEASSLSACKKTLSICADIYSSTSLDGVSG